MTVDPVIGTEVSGYVVKGQLGQGGMGIVYEGEQPTIGKRVAIKVLRHEVADNPDVVQRLVSEARAVNQVGHRGIIDVFGVGQLPDGRQCIVMEFLDGESLETLLTLYRTQNRLMPVADALVILDEILSALAAAHRAGVVHRDVKPSNIFLCKQQDGTQYVKLLDFGIAKLGALGKATPTTRGMMMGTPLYMAPEQARMASGSPSMDLYALGVVFFEMLTNQLPFVRDSIVALLLAHQSDPPPRPSSLTPSVPAELDAVVMRLLEKEVAQRYQTADEVRAEIIRLRKELPSHPAPIVVVRVDEPAPPQKATLPPPEAPRVAKRATDLVGAVDEAPRPLASALQPALEPDDLKALNPSSSRRWVVLSVAAIAAAAFGAAQLWHDDAVPAPELTSPVRAEVSSPTPPTPVVQVPAAAPDSPAVVVPEHHPQPKRVAAAKPTATSSHKPAAAATPGKSFEARFDAVATQLKQAEAEGQDVTTELFQLKKGRELLRGDRTQERLDQIEATLSRLEEDAAKY